MPCALAVLVACANSAMATEPEHGYGPDMFAFVAGADTAHATRSCWALAAAMGSDTAYTDRTVRFAFERVAEGEHRLHVVEEDHPRRTAPEAPSTYWHAVAFGDTARANVSGPNASIEVVLDAGTDPVVAGRFLRLSGARRGGPCRRDWRSRCTHRTARPSWAGAPRTPTAKSCSAPCPSRTSETTGCGARRGSSAPIPATHATPATAREHARRRIPLGDPAVRGLARGRWSARAPGAVRRDGWR